MFSKRKCLKKLFDFVQFDRRTFRLLLVKSCSKTTTFVNDNKYKSLPWFRGNLEQTPLISTWIHITNQHEPVSFNLIGPIHSYTSCSWIYWLKMHFLRFSRFQVDTRKNVFCHWSVLLECFLHIVLRVLGTRKSVGFVAQDKISLRGSNLRLKLLVGFVN